MRVPLGWLAEFVDLPERVDELCDRLTSGGLEIEMVADSIPSLEGVIVGHVVERAAHRKADRLSVCQVDIGLPEGPVQIVCGAPNVGAGQKVAVIRPGSKLPDGTKIKKAKIRGETSLGMICSQRELGLGDEHEGIWVLGDDVAVGQDLAEVLGNDAAVLDVEITPNRGDWASLLGIAREVRAQFGHDVRVPSSEVAEAKRPAADDANVTIVDADGCYHYVARIVRGVTVGPSPDWVKNKLVAAGLRSIDNVVDATNLVLLELGQPLHAFDLATLRGGRVEVRGAVEGEKILTLDGQTRELDAGDLVIADAERAIAIAGVMGGAETEVTAKTRDLLIESAHFAPSRVRKTARRLGLHSEASYRFERGVDPEGVARAADRCAKLIGELTGGSVSAGRVEARGAAFERCEVVEMDPGHPRRLIGVDLSADEVMALLARVDIEVTSQPEGKLRCSLPSYRNDISIAVDLVEEVARVYGYDRIPTTMPTAALEPVAIPAAMQLADRVRDALKAAGCLEARTFPAMRDLDFDALRLPADAPQRRALRIHNPVIDEDRWLQTTLVAGLLRCTQRNLSRQVDRVRLFEVAEVFVPREGELPSEPVHAALVLTRGEPQNPWESRERAPLFFELKGIVERLLRELGYEGRFQAGADRAYLHPGAAGSVRVGKHAIASLGELHPEVASAYEIDRPCGVLEIDLSRLLGQKMRTVQMRPVSPYPAVRRDMAVLVGRDQPAGDILEQIRRSAGQDAIDVALFDRYEGEGIPDGKVSLAFRLTYQRPDRTLTDGEVLKSTDRIVRMLAERFRGELR